MELQFENPWNNKLILNTILDAGNSIIHLDRICFNVWLINI